MSIIFMQILSIIFGINSAVLWGTQSYIIMPPITRGDINDDHALQKGTLKFDTSAPLIVEFKSYFSELALLFRWRKELEKYENSYFAYLAFISRLNRSAAISAIFSVLFFGIVIDHRLDI